MCLYMVLERNFSHFLTVSLALSQHPELGFCNLDCQVIEGCKAMFLIFTKPPKISGSSAQESTGFSLTPWKVRELSKCYVYLVVQNITQVKHLRKRLIDDCRHSILWITDFPMFEWNDLKNRLEALHHLFTAPNPEDMNDLASACALAYDMVYNGVEIGGGSLRIYKRDIQQKGFGDCCI
ncbi:hypothetical protein L6164_017599 [Bauhinia variegata]|uniref:Uncharacterized protein n=1 Tax=Bauhinia variegata TaxID=167791 RepID=A0ACB9N8B3_BAUVA|nr:hypothetical protein L6164_017599 [Bauhinia variegata]